MSQPLKKGRGESNPNAALFCSVNVGHKQGRLSTQAIYNVVSETAKLAGVNKVLSPHRIRHSSITAALDMTNGDVMLIFITRFNISGDRP